MGTAWERRDIPKGPNDPTEPEVERRRRKLEPPRTLMTFTGQGLRQERIFDPALLHFSDAYRASEPVFDDRPAGMAWRTARREALHSVLAAIAGSAWVDCLTLRGSVLLDAWFGDAAREPGDLDFVVVPPDWRIEEGRTQRMLDAVAEAAERTAEQRGGRVRISARGARSEYIWTYDRVPGRRMVLPWAAPGVPGGLVQLDFVFNELMPVPPEPTEVGPGSLLWAATPELSLAWKLLWLFTDLHPQGKDLYDAVLLAERHPLPYELLEAVFKPYDAAWYASNPVALSHFQDLDCESEWADFRAEYPHLAGDCRAYHDRLIAALAPTFAGR
ncbi:nucleotidyl transferase AbiEii/AbiGii toxin family protein [Streptomyces sp. NPDC001514]